MKKQVNILVVDDNQDNLKVISNILKEKGYKLALSLDGASALKTLDSTDIDLVLLDIMMPGMNGFEVCKMIKANPKTVNIPVIFVTADTDDISEGFKAGGVDYISKPFRTDELLARVSNQVQLAIAKASLDDSVKQLSKALNSTENLLKSLLPQHIIAEYKQTCRVKPKIYSNVCILAVDLMHFTEISASLSPEMFFNELNELYTDFDEILDKNGCERIKTAGDSYLGISGMETMSDSYIVNMLEAAQDIMKYLSKRNRVEPIKWEIRIGIDSGSIIGGIIGEKRLRFDIFGKPVSSAFHLASTAKEMQINVSDSIYNKYRDRYEFLNVEHKMVEEPEVVKMHLLKMPI